MLNNGLSQLFRGSPRRATPECPHARLVPRWRGPEVMDDPSRAMGYVCHACRREFLSYRVRDGKLIQL